MAKNKRIMAGLDKVGHMLSRAKKTNRKLSSKQVLDARQTLKEATKELFRLRVMNSRNAKVIAEKRQALKKSVKESLITEADSKEEAKKLISSSVQNKVHAKRITASIEAVKKLAGELSSFAPAPKKAVKKEETKKEETKKVDSEKKTFDKKEAMRARIKESVKKRIAERRKKAMEDASQKEAASPRDEQLDKGVDTSGQIKDQPKVTVKAPDESTPQNVGVDKSGIGNEEELNTAPQMAKKPPVRSQKLSAKKLRAKNMYAKAVELVKKAEAEKDEKVKATLNRRASMLEKMADTLTKPEEKKAGKEKPTLAEKKREAIRKRIAEKKKQASTASKKETASEEKEATTVTVAANDTVILPDGVVGKVSAVDGEKLMVNVGGVDKEVLSNSVKKVTSCDTSKGKEAKPSDKKKTMSVSEKVREAIKAVKGGKKKTAQEDVLPAVAEDAPLETVEEIASEAGDTVAQTDTKAVNYVDGLGWTVNKTENEVVNFGEDKEGAEAFVKSMSKNKKAVKQDPIIDSANVQKPASQEDTVKKLKGLDQQGKDYGKTTKDEKVNPQTSMIGKASKQKTATDHTPDSPVDSATTKRPSPSEDISKKLRGLDQQGKDYGTTKADQKINPQLSVYARKNRIITETNKKQAERLAVVESRLLIDRAVKVGALTEEQRSNQETVLAELYANSRAEFNAFDRLIANLEKTKGTKVSVASRLVKKIQNSVDNREHVPIDGESGMRTGSLEDGTFFDEEVD